MPTSVVVLQIMQPGEQADELVRAATASFGFEWNGEAPDGLVRLFSGTAYPVALQRAKRALFLAGGGPEVVVLEGQ